MIVSQVNHDDITVLNIFIEIANTNKLKYLLYEMNITDTTGEIVKILKFIKLLRIKRLPKIAKQETKFMGIHAKLMSGVWERQNEGNVDRFCVKQIYYILFLYCLVVDLE